MGAPLWWKQRRFGLMIQANLASVPSWAPIGQYASWYYAHTESEARDVLLHPSPLVETLAHHRDRWSHVDEHDDFLPFLTFADFDPDEWMSLARDAGMGYVVATAKHHDGLCWWDAPATDRTVLHGGPKRNVLAEIAAACERADLTFGTSYSLLDWSDARYPSAEYVDDVVHPHVLDLVERYGTRMLWGDAHWGAGPDHWRAEALVKLALEIDSEIVVNDRWWLPGCVRSYEYRVPADIMTDESFEVRRGIGSGFGHNRVELDEHLLTASQIVALLTEVVAKGGHLLLSVGADATGRVPDHAAERLRAAGGWVRRHGSLIADGEPWDTWGDEHCRYLMVGDSLHVVDVGGRGRFRALTSDRGGVAAIRSLDGEPVRFEQRDDGVTLDRQPRRASRLPTVYVIDLEAPPEPPIELFALEPDAGATHLAPLLDDARPGSIVQLGDGRYLGPARVPPGVTLRGLGPERTVIDGRESPAIVLSTDARLEHCALVGGGQRIVWLPKQVVSMPGDRSTVIGCDVEGHVDVTGDDVRIRSCRLVGVTADAAERVDICRSTFTGMDWDCAVDIAGGSRHVVEGCEFRHVLQAIRLTGTVGAEVRGNQIRARWWGLQLVDAEATVAVGNSVNGTMRAIDVDGGTEAHIAGNAVSDGDSGCVVQGGASAVEVTGNHWERCRVGLFAWEAGTVRHHDNICVDLVEADAEVVSGP